MRSLPVLNRRPRRPPRPDWQVVAAGVLVVAAVWGPLTALLRRLGPGSAIGALAAACALANGVIVGRTERPWKVALWVSVLAAAAAALVAWAAAERLGARFAGLALALCGSALLGGFAGAWLRTRGRIR